MYQPSFCIAVVTIRCANTKLQWYQCTSTLCSRAKAPRAPARPLYVHKLPTQISVTSSNALRMTTRWPLQRCGDLEVPLELHSLMREARSIATSKPLPY
jgi:hypothetical protein